MDKEQHKATALVRGNSKNYFFGRMVWYKTFFWNLHKVYGTFMATPRFMLKLKLSRIQKRSLT